MHSSYVYFYNMHTLRLYCTMNFIPYNVTCFYVENSFQKYFDIDYTRQAPSEI